MNKILTYIYIFIYKCHRPICSHLSAKFMPSLHTAWWLPWSKFGRQGYTPLCAILWQKCLQAHPVYGQGQKVVLKKKEKKTRNPYFYKLKHGFWIIIVVKTMVFHTFDYKNHVLAYKNKGFVVLAHFFFVKDNFLTLAVDWMSLAAGRASPSSRARPTVRKLSLKKKRSQNHETLIFIS